MASSGLEQKIADLCQAWVDAIRPDSSGVVRVPGNEHRLHTNGIVFHELNYSELRAACVGLIRVLLFGKLNSVIDRDHLLLWSWAADLILYRNPLIVSLFSNDELEIRELFETTVTALFAEARQPPPSSKEEMKAWWDLEHRVLTPELKDFIGARHLIVAYLSFPLLEAMLKKAAAAFVSYSGEALQPWDAPRLDGGAYILGGPRDRPYIPGKRRCSSMRDLLFLVYERVADADLKSDLDIIRAHLQQFDTSADPFQIVYQWRNSSLHGHTSFPTIGGTVLSLTILVTLFQIRETFEGRKAKVLETIKFQRDMDLNDRPFTFYRL